MSHEKINYLEIFHQHGLRFTHQRQMVLDAVCQAEGHATISQIIFNTRKLDDSIDPSTVYRSLELFEKLGLVVSGEKVFGEETYEVVQEQHHHHLICRGCGADVEIEEDLVDNFYLQLKTLYGYRVGMDHLIVFGLCKDCLSS